MFSRFLFSAVLFASLMLSGLMASAQSDSLDQTSGEAYSVSGSVSDPSLDGSAQSAEVLHSWRFLGCVHHAHDCEHEANHHGYHHYRVRSHSPYCHHDEYACYGRN